MHHRGPDFAAGASTAQPPAMAKQPSISNWTLTLPPPMRVTIESLFASLLGATGASTGNDMSPRVVGVGMRRHHGAEVRDPERLQPLHDRCPALAAIDKEVMAPDADQFRVTLANIDEGDLEPAGGGRGRRGGRRRQHVSRSRNPTRLSHRVTSATDRGKTSVLRPYRGVAK